MNHCDARYMCAPLISNFSIPRLGDQYIVFVTCLSIMFNFFYVRDHKSLNITPLFIVCCTILNCGVSFPHCHCFINTYVIICI